MPENVRELADAVVGHKIIAAEKGASVTRISEWRQPYQVTGTVLHLDNGVRVMLADSGDCCAYTELEAFLLHRKRIDHVITGVGTTGAHHLAHLRGHGRRAGADRGPAAATRSITRTALTSP